MSLHGENKVRDFIKKSKSEFKVAKCVRGDKFIHIIGTNTQDEKQRNFHKKLSKHMNENNCVSCGIQLRSDQYASAHIRLSKGSKVYLITTCGPCNVKGTEFSAKWSYWCTILETKRLDYELA